MVLAADHLGVGASSKPADGDRVNFETMSAAAASFVAQVRRMLADGSPELGGRPLPSVPIIGVGHSLGACLTVVHQARHRCYDAVALLGFTHGQRRSRSRPSGPPSASPSTTRTRCARRHRAGEGVLRRDVGRRLRILPLASPTMPGSIIPTSPQQSSRPTMPRRPDGRANPTSRHSSQDTAPGSPPSSIATSSSDSAIATSHPSPTPTWPSIPAVRTSPCTSCPTPLTATTSPPPELSSGTASASGLASRARPRRTVEEAGSAHTRRRHGVPLTVASGRRSSTPAGRWRLEANAAATARTKSAFTPTSPSRNARSHAPPQHPPRTLPAPTSCAPCWNRGDYAEPLTPQPGAEPAPTDSQAPTRHNPRLGIRRTSTAMPAPPAGAVVPVVDAQPAAAAVLTRLGHVAAQLPDQEPHAAGGDPGDPLAGLGVGGTVVVGAEQRVDEEAGDVDVARVDACQVVNERVAEVEVDAVAWSASSRSCASRSRLATAPGSAGCLLARAAPIASATAASRCRRICGVRVAEVGARPARPGRRAGPRRHGRRPPPPRRALLPAGPLRRGVRGSTRRDAERVASRRLRAPCR